MPPAEAIFHITDPAVWATALANDSFQPDSLSTEGFIHCSTASQYPTVARVRFPGRRDLLLLTIDPARLAAAVRWEAVDGDRFPHVYGPINLDAVIHVQPLSPVGVGAADPLELP